MAEELTRQGHPVSDKTVARCLRKMGYSMQLNQKTREGPQHRNRDQQFRYINRRISAVPEGGYLPVDVAEPGPAVPLHQPAGSLLPEQRRSGAVGGHEEERIGGTL